MSAAASSRHRAPSKGSGRSTAMRPAQQQEFSTMPPARFFEPCAATGNMFLYAQGASVICCQHDTLSIERIFSSHAEEIQLLAVDNHSDLGSGRFVVSYDAGQTAIVWDLATGDEVARFASYEHLTAAAWMKSGSVAFGNMQGSIILFEPTTSEHISSRTLDQIPVTSLAPSSDCRTFAIGYQNGTLLIATLQPRFTILHNLTTSRGPSPLVTLSWHASSSRQKSDMLATQTLNGDLRVWSIAKSHSAEDAAKVVRILKRSENFSEGPNWMGWSKNGRVIQFSDSQTLSWDVRTKHVTSDNIPTLEHVRGLALWGPGAILFTLGRSGTVQQFDLNTPSIMVNNVQHPVNSLPPSPPNSIEEPEAKSTHSTTTIHTSESENSSIPLEMGVSESDEDHLSPFDRFVRRPALDSGSELPYETTGSPVSSRSGASDISRSSGGSKTPGMHNGSLRSRGNKTENTYISAGSSLKSSTIGNSGYGRRQEMDMYSMGYSIGTTSVPSVPSTRSRHRPSRLRNEVPRSPDDNRVHDLFKYTRTRLTDLPYKHPANANNSRLTNDDLRRQMLSTIFGWHKDVEDLISDEMSRHPAGSANRILLAKWLGEMETDLMAAGTENMTSSDWMLLALSGIGGQASQQKVGRTYVQRLLETGDVHVAVTIMLGMGDHNDAIEVYVSHKRYMEALILTCLVFPSVWERQASIIRKWGKHEILRRNEQLAIRCFACTDSEPTEAWTSPSATQLNFQQTITPSIPEMLSPPLSPPGVQRGPQRSIAKTSALKLITSFGDSGKKAKFYSQGDDGQTPIAAGPTPIADSAISPGGAYDAATAFLRPSSNSRFNTPTSARPRGRLPSIGENTMDANNRGAIDLALASLRNEKQEVGAHARKASLEQDNLVIGNTLHRAATASPMMVRDRKTPVEHRNNQPSPPSPTKDFMAKVHDIRANRRNGSRDRIPQGLHLELKALANEVNALSPDQTMPSSSKYHWPTPTRRRGPGSVSSVTSASSAGKSLRQGQRHKDDYIHSLDAASRYSKKGRNLHSSKERTRDSSRGRNASAERKARSREPSEERGRGSSRAWHKPKRSPTSPVPMSPEDIAILSTPRAAEAGEPVTVRKTSSTYKSKPKSRNSSRGSRRQSPDARARLTPLDTRGRSKGVDEEGLQTTSPALPLSATILHYEGSEDEEDYRRAVEAQELFRAKHNGSASKGPSSPVATKRDRSGSRRRDVSEFRDIPPPPLSVHGRAASTEHAGDLRLMKEERQRKKEQAARELEERRKSLAQRARAPSIPNPGQNSMDIRHVVVETSSPVPSPGEQPRCATAPLPKGGFTSARHTPVIGLPATPKAMRIAYDAESAQELPKIPSIPPSFVVEKTEEPSYEQPPSNQQPKQADPFTLLPSTVYQPPTRPFIPRSMSAPIPDDPSPRRRKGSSAELRGIDEIVNGGRRRRSQEEPLMPPPPPPPPAPPLLKELQHLATPPPPPPAPLPNMRRPQGGALGSGMIEIVMDDDEGDAPVAAPNDGMVPVIPPPAPPASKSHSRGRSTGDTSISGRISKATERLRSASRGPKESRAVRSPHVEAPYESIPTQHLKSGISANHSVPILSSAMYDQDIVRSPHAEAPYESVPTQHLKTGVGANHSISIPPPVMYDQDIVRSPVEGRGAFMSTGMHKSEMI